MSTKNDILSYVTKFNQHLEKDLSKFRRTTLWVHRHTRVLNITASALATIGSASIAFLPLTMPLWGAGAVALAAAGGILGVVTVLAYQILSISMPLAHDMRNHMFRPESCPGGRIYYQGDVPVLELEADDPVIAGQAHGFLLGSYIEKVIKRMDFAMMLSRVIGGIRPQAAQTPATLAAIKATLPSEYVAELEGVVAGYNRWAKQRKWLSAREVTFNELLMFHLMPDHLHFNALEHERSLTNSTGTANIAVQDPQDIFPAMGCLAIVDKNRMDGITFARNMDWPHLGLFGALSLLVHRIHSTGSRKLSTWEVGIPGFIGTLTGMNAKGLCLGMNVCRGDTKEVNGMPSAFFNRLCLENCADVEEVESMLKQNAPLGKYNLIVADPNQAKAFHVHQGLGPESYHQTPLEGNVPLVVANYEYGPDGSRKNDINSSEARHQMVEAFYRECKNHVVNGKGGDVACGALSLHKTNHSSTTHTVVMRPKVMEMQVSFDNGFSASSPLYKVVFG